MPAKSDDANPKTIKLEYGIDYRLQAFLGEGKDRLRSAPYPLSFSFLPAVITFSADRSHVDFGHQTATLSWTVVNAKSVTYQGQPVDLSGSRQETPKTDTTYALAVTWVNGNLVAPTSTVTVTAAPVVAVYGDRLDASIADRGLWFSLQLTVSNATSASVGPIGCKVIAPNAWTVLPSLEPQQMTKGTDGTTWSFAGTIPTSGRLWVAPNTVAELTFDIVADRTSR